MIWDGLNDDQRDYRQSLSKIPRDQRCVSGWHITKDGPCTCMPVDERKSQ